MISLEQISEKLESLSIFEIAQLSKFTARIGGKITPLNFVLSFFASIQTDKHSLTSWTEALSILLNQTISYNAMKKAQNSARAEFAEALLGAALSKQILTTHRSKYHTQLLDGFNRVYLEDSTCVSLPKSLYEFFPGPHSNTGHAATAKIQLRVELKSGTYSNIALKHYRNNDQSFSSDILQMLQPGDLVIRDLGYAVLDVFEKIDKSKAFFISRLKYGTKLFDYDTEEEIDLAKQLRKARKNKQAVVELFVRAGKKAKLPVRICAVKCPPAEARKRIARAKKDRHQGANHSKDYFELLGWVIFITNVSEQTLSAQQILEVYGYRWRIEIIFKTWKSHFKLDRLFQTQAKLSEQHVRIAISLFLVWITLFFTKMYNFFLHKIYYSKGKVLSLMKFAKFVKEHIQQLLVNPDLDFWIDHLAYFCCYKKRKGKPNFCQQLYLLI